MVDIKTLLPDLRKLVGALAEDLLARSTSDAKIDSGLREAFHQIEHGGRTAQAFEVWREDYLDQVAVAWVLACVFVRFMEDNGLIDECWLAGEGERRRLAEDTHELFFRKNPHDTDREYFQHVFKEVGQIPAAKDLFAEGKTPLWAVAPSGDAAMKLLKFWREMDAESGHLKRSLQVVSGDTRFLGDLYQELSEKAKKKYALLQTPVFVEEFILDRTLTPALAEFGLEKVRMIDPTCGSGHFLLGGFARLFDLWSQRESNEIKAAQKALDGVWGVDINPFAVAIARFRLIVAAVQACGIKRLKQAPGWNIHLASGDSLLFGSKPSFGGQRVGIAQQLSLFEVPAIYAVEDRKMLQEILGQGYHVVVGNPPYITVKDPQQNEAYRTLYSTCHRQYSLGAPFTQRFWELAKQQDEQAHSSAGFIGLITANSFMKREFGKKLVEEFFPKVDLTCVIDTSRAYIPGHGMPDGTPTAILFGRARRPICDSVRTVLGVLGEPSVPDDPSHGMVWTSILSHIDSVGSSDDFTCCVDMPRERFCIHPWNIGGGGASDLKSAIELNCKRTLGDIIADIGRSTHTGEDDAFYLEESACRTRSLIEDTLPLVEGEGIRDFVLSYSLRAVFPYDRNTATPREVTNTNVVLHYWRFRTVLKRRKDFGQYIEERGLRWVDHSMFFPSRFLSRRFLAYAEIATHNHFVLEEHGKLFKHSTGVIILPATASESDQIGLLGSLTNSTACFLLKNLCFEKGGRGEHWEWRYVFNSTNLKKLSIPDVGPEENALRLFNSSSESQQWLPQSNLASGVLAREKWSSLRTGFLSAIGQMIALQEELDWHCYQLYGLLPDDLRYSGEDLPELALGQRAFEIVMARQMAKGELETTWFERHGSTPITEIPTHWPAAYRKLVERRIKLIETNKEIALIEKPEYKRRWNTEPWEEQEQRALKNWLLDRLETAKYGKGTKDHPELTTTAQMADVASADAEFQQVAALYRGRPDFDVAALVAELVEAEAVPLLPILRYKATGLRKREVWERTWNLQRKVDDYERQRKEADALISKAEKRLSEVLSPLLEELEKLEEPLNELREKYSRKWLSQLKKLLHEQPEETARRLAGELPEQALSQLDALEELAASFNNKHSDFEKRKQKLFATDEEYQKAIKWRNSIPDDPEIDVPPKYASSDFLKTDYWRLRGKLDVPKERWVSYPHCSTDSDPTLVVGWAGWNHLEQATALIAYYDARKREGWDAKRLTPLLAGLDQLLPWIHQWHPEIDAEFGETAGQSFQVMLEHDAHELGLTLEDIRNWTPPEKAKKTPKGRKKKSEAEADE